jgi:hypothetical protein
MALNTNDPTIFLTTDQVREITEFEALCEAQHLANIVIREWAAWVAEDPSRRPAWGDLNPDEQAAILRVASAARA